LCRGWASHLRGLHEPQRGRFAAPPALDNLLIAGKKQALLGAQMKMPGAPFGRKPGLFYPTCAQNKADLRQARDRRTLRDFQFPE
jgi:hypothetical protein